MKPNLKLVCALLLVLVAPAAFASPSSVVLLFNGNTEVNRHVYAVLSQALSGTYRVTPTLDPSTIKPGANKAVIVISTKTSTGLDPVLESFLKGYAAPKELFLISLLSRSGQLTVTPFAPGTGPFGIDGLTAATTWSRSAQAMHRQWLQLVVDAIAAR